MAGEIKWVQRDDGSDMGCSLFLGDGEGQLYVGELSEEPGIFITLNGKTIGKVDDGELAYAMVSGLSKALLASRFKAMGLGTRRRRRKTGGDDAS